MIWQVQNWAVLLRHLYTEKSTCCLLKIMSDPGYKRGSLAKYACQLWLWFLMLLLVHTLCVYFQTCHFGNILWTVIFNVSTILFFVCPMEFHFIPKVPFLKTCTESPIFSSLIFDTTFICSWNRDMSYLVKTNGKCNVRLDPKVTTTIMKIITENNVSYLFTNSSEINYLHILEYKTT